MVTLQIMDDDMEKIQVAVEGILSGFFSKIENDNLVTPELSKFVAYDMKNGIVRVDISTK